MDNDDFDFKNIMVNRYQARFEPESSPRFGSLITQNDLMKNFKAAMPKKTIEQTKWSMNIYSEWRRSAIIEFGEKWKNHEKWPIPDIERGDISNLDFWFSQFILSARNQKGKEYPPKSLQQIVSGVQRFLREIKENPKLNILSDKEYHLIKKTLVYKCKELTAERVGLDVKRADPINICDEIKLWESGTFAFDTAEGLSYAVFFYNCKVFGLNMDEHRSLQTSQYWLVTNSSKQDVKLHFTSSDSKNVQGGPNHKNIEVRNIDQFADPDNPRCIVRLFKSYLSLIESGDFYRRPLPQKTLNGKPRFSSAPIGKNTLAKYIKTIVQKAGINSDGRNITNHSGKITCCTTLYNEGIDEQSICSRSGHRSNAVRLYSRPKEDHMKKISTILQPPKPKENISPQILKENMPLQNQESEEPPSKRPKNEIPQETTDPSEVKDSKQLEIRSFSIDGQNGDNSGDPSELIPETPKNVVTLESPDALWHLEEMATSLIDQAQKMATSLIDQSQKMANSLVNQAQQMKVLIEQAKVQPNANKETVTPPQSRIQYENKKDMCENCGRKAISECTGCHQVGYCSTFCQRRDWSSSHHLICETSEGEDSIPTHPTVEKRATVKKRLGKRKASNSDDDESGQDK